jgi:hypothetical protein
VGTRVAVAVALRVAVAVVVDVTLAVAVVVDVTLAVAVADAVGLTVAGTLAVTATDAVTVGDHSAVITGITTRVAVATPVGESAGDVAPPGVAVPVGTTVVARLIDVATATLGSGVGDATTGVAGSVVASAARPGVAVMPDAPTGAVGATIDATPRHANATPTTMCKARQRERPPADAGATPGGHEWLPVAPIRAGTPPAGERFRSPVIGGASTGIERHGDAAVPGGPEARREASRRTSA